MTTLHRWRAVGGLGFAAVDLVVAAVVGVLALPAGWIACVLVERVPDRARRVFERPFRAESTSPNRTVATVVLVVVVAVLMASAAPTDGGLQTLIPVVCLVGFGYVLTVLALIDLDTQRLPDRLVLPSLAVSIPTVVATSVVLRQPDRVGAAFTGALVYFGFLFLVHLIAGPRAIGFGDVKLAALMGLWVGWTVHSPMRALGLVFWAMFLGFLVGAFLGIFLLAVRRGSHHYAFGPFLALGAVAAVVLAEGLLP